MSRTSKSIESSTQIADQPSLEESVKQVHIAILGTGFSGLGMAIGLKKSGFSDFIVMEKAPEVGGTWRDNTYPGDPLASLLILLCTQSQLEPGLFGPGRDPAIFA